MERRQGDPSPTRRSRLIARTGLQRSSRCASSTATRDGLCEEAEGVPSRARSRALVSCNHTAKDKSAIAFRKTNSPTAGGVWRSGTISQNELALDAGRCCARAPFRKTKCAGRGSVLCPSTISQNELAGRGSVLRSSTISQNELALDAGRCCARAPFRKTKCARKRRVATGDSRAEFVLNLYFQFPSRRPILDCVVERRNLGGGTLDRGHCGYCDSKATFRKTSSRRRPCTG